jgi:hypothetical protein
MSHSQFHCIPFILRHAWLSLWDKHMTTGRINQITTLGPSHEGTEHDGTLLNCFSSHADRFCHSQYLQIWRILQASRAVRSHLLPTSPQSPKQVWEELRRGLAVESCSANLLRRRNLESRSQQDLHKLAYLAILPHICTIISFPTKGLIWEAPGLFAQESVVIKSCFSVADFVRNDRIGQKLYV